MSPRASSLLTRSPDELVTSATGYNRVAKHYDRWAWQDFWRKNEFPIVLTKLIEVAPTRAILDLGIGTGAFFSCARPHFPPELRLVGLDISIGMLERARSRLGTSVGLLLADLERGLPFPDSSFDAVIMMRAANHLQHLSVVVVEIGRVLSTGGLFMATDLADEYEYICTRIPTPQGKVCIETYKHSQTEWNRALAVNFSAVTVQEYTPLQLRETVLASKCLAKDVPIFKLITARKRN
jgi:ubiquinone/menaquinone biosynthesis C-methylase UbiE